MTDEFRSTVVAVTGAGRGMGLSIAKAFCDAGAAVMLGARTLSYGEAAVRHLKEQGHAADVVKADACYRADMENLVAATVERFGSLDVLIHCAAEVPHGSVLEVSDDAIDGGLASVIKAAFWLTRAAAPHLSKARGGGRIVCISSVCGPNTVFEGLAAYAVAKGGLDAFIRSAALDLARRSITVNGVNPGTIYTDRMRASLSAEHATKMSSVIPVGRIGNADEIARAVLFLASPAASYITGQTITVDGGWTLSAPGTEFEFYKDKVTTVA